ncbi:MAG: TolC family protein [Bacteroidales bacterium]
MRRTLKFKGIIFLTLFFAISSFYLHAQKPLTLKECINYSNTNNSNIKIANYDVTISQKKVNEQVGTMLPQIEASGAYTDNLKLSTTVLPGELMGQPGTQIPITMGTKHNLSGSVQLNQKIFDPTFGIALSAAKISKQLSVQTLKKTSEQTAYNISITYYQTLVIEKQMNSLRATLVASEKLLESTELKHKNGMAKKIDVDKIRVSYNNTNSQLQQSELSYKQSLNTLKYQMGMPVDSSIVLLDTDLSISFQTIEIQPYIFSVDNHIDYQLQKTNLNVSEMDKKRNIAGYLPSLSFNANYGYSAMRNKFDFTKSGGDWYQSSSIGITLKVPIFDGLQRNAKIAQSKLNIEKSLENIRLTEQSIKVELSNSEIQYRNAVENIRSEKENLDLSENVYENTQLQYQQGAGSSLDLVQAESSYRESLNNYYNKLLNLYIARINLEQSKGTLMNYINNLK